MTKNYCSCFLVFSFEANRLRVAVVLAFISANFRKLASVVMMLNFHVQFWFIMVIVLTHVLCFM